jgi:hypothetical protein
MKKSISNNKKSPVNTNDNKDEVSIDVNLLLHDPKSLHKMLNKESDDNDYVPTNSNPNKLSNRPKNPYKGRPYYYDEGLWKGKKPAKGQQFELETMKVKTERKQERKANEQLEKLKAMRPVKKKEEIDDIPEFAPYAKKKYGKEDVIEDTRSPLTFFKEEGSKMLKNNSSKKEEKGSELIKKHMDKEKKENVKGNDEHPLLWNERIDAYLKNRLPEEKYDDLKNRWRKEENKPHGKAADKLWEDGSYLDGTNFKNKILKYKGKNNK